MSDPEDFTSTSIIRPGAGAYPLTPRRKRQLVLFLLLLAFLIYESRGLAVYYKAPAVWKQKAEQKHPAAAMPVR